MTDETEDHALHFDPDCEECAYLARPTRETLALPDDGREGLDKTAEERRMTRAHPWAIAHEGIAGIKATPDSENEP